VSFIRLASIQTTRFFPLGGNMPGTVINMNEDHGVNVFPPGHLIDSKYKINKYLGSGASGDVYQVTNIENELFFAIKFLNLTSDEYAVERFQREVRSLASVNHQNVIKVLGSNLEFIPPYFVMPLAKNNLDDVIKTLKSDPLKCLSLAKDVCMGLIAIHNAGITHRDIKPSNILILENDRIVISDFGIAKFNERDTKILTQTNASLGTFAYCAPEQLIAGGSRSADARTDIYQFGKTLYELFTGEHPAIFDDDKLDGPLFSILNKATQNNPDRRYKNLSEVFDALLEYEAYLNPETSKFDQFSAAIAEANRLLEDNKYKSTNIFTIIKLLNDLSTDPSDFINSFEKIPDNLLPTFAKTFTSDFTELITIYANCIKSRLGKAPYYNFEYADIIANKMEISFNAATTPELKMGTMRCTLLASVLRNRFSAMSVFDKMLLSIKTTEEIFFTAEMLKSELDYYINVADRLSSNQLPPSIKAIQELALKK